MLGNFGVAVAPGWMKFTYSIANLHITSVSVSMHVRNLKGPRFQELGLWSQVDKDSAFTALLRKPARVRDCQPRTKT